MARGPLATLALACAAVAVLFAAPAEAVIGKKDWNKVDFDKAEKELEADDDPELLVSDEALVAKEFEKRKQMPLRPPEDAGLKDPTEWIKHQQAMSGPAMLFCTLVPTNPKAKKKDGGDAAASAEWTNESITMVAYEWRELLKTAGLEAQVYDISDAAAREKAKKEGTPMPAPQVLVTTNTGWRGYEMRDFLLAQPEMAALEWDQVKYTPADLDPVTGTVRGPHGRKGASDPTMQSLMRQLNGEADSGSSAAAAGKKKKGNKGKGKGGKGKASGDEL